MDESGEQEWADQPVTSPRLVRIQSSISIFLPLERELIT